MKRSNQFRGDQPQLGFYNGYKRYRGSESGNAYNQEGTSYEESNYQNGNGSSFTSNNGMSNQEFETLKYRYGNIIALLLEKGITCYQIQQGVRQSDSILDGVVKQLQTQREAIVQARPKSAQYLHQAFYLGLRVSPGNKEQNQNGQWISEVTYLGGQKAIKTLLVRNERELDKYCSSVEELLVQRLTAETLEEDDTLNQIEKSLMQLIQGTTGANGATSKTDQSAPSPIQTTDANITSDISIQLQALNEGEVIPSSGDRPVTLKDSSLNVGYTASVF